MINPEDLQADADELDHAVVVLRVALDDHDVEQDRLALGEFISDMVHAPTEYLACSVICLLADYYACKIIQHGIGAPADEPLMIVANVSKTRTHEVFFPEGLGEREDTTPEDWAAMTVSMRLLDPSPAVALSNWAKTSVDYMTPYYRTESVLALASLAAQCRKREPGWFYAEGIAA